MQPETKPNGSDEGMTRGLLLFQKKGKSITENEDGSWTVPSQYDATRSYEVRLLGGKYVCICHDFETREIGFCKLGFTIISKTSFST